jgi:hypothetical protein
MTQIQGQPAPSQFSALSGGTRPELTDIMRLAAVFKAADAKPDAHDGLRARILEIGAGAERLQKAACMACAVVETLDRMEASLSVALEAARGESAAARSQLDLALGVFDRQAAEASFAGEALFGGGGEIAAAGGAMALPEITSRTLIADSSAEAIEAGLARLRETRGAVDEFYQSAVLPAVAEASVTLSNAIAAELTSDGIEQAIDLLAQVQGEMDTASAGRASSGGRGVLRLLE